MTAEEIILKLGLDGTSLSQGLREGKSKVMEFAAETKSKFTEVLAGLGVGLGVGALVEGLRKLAEEAHRIKTMSEGLGVSTGFTQYLENAGRLAGESGEAVEAMMAKWEASLPVGTDLESAFEGVMKRLEEMKDPTERMAAAFDLFGKKGEMALKMAAQWKEAKGMAIMSESQIKMLEEGSRQMEQATQQVKVWGAGIVQGIADLAQAIGRAQAIGGTIHDNLKNIITERANSGRADSAASKTNRARLAKEAQGRSDAEGQESYAHKMGDIVLQHGTADEKLHVLVERFKEVSKAMDGVRHGSKEWWDMLGKTKDIQQSIYDITTKQAEENKKAADEKKKEHDQLTKDAGKIDREIGRTRDEMSKGLEPTEKELIGSGSWVDAGRMAGSRQHGRRFVQSAGSQAASEIQQRENIIKAANSGFYGLDKKNNEGIVKEQTDAIGRVRKWMGEHGIHTQEQDHAKEIAEKLAALTEDRAAITVKLKNSK